LELGLKTLRLSHLSYCSFERNKMRAFRDAVCLHDNESARIVFIFLQAALALS